MTTNSSTALTVLAIPAFNDNYIWLIHDGKNAAVVDPGEADNVLSALITHELNLSAILLTHHHHDHTGGVAQLLQHYAVPVFGPRNEKIATMTQPLTEGDIVRVPGLNVEMAVLDVPGHTSGHIAYVSAQHKGEPASLFCGDTLFAGGCGRLFEGTPQQMLESLEKLSKLPDETLVYCAHEYTLSNLRFAIAIDPENRILQERITSDRAKRANGLPTVPSTLGMEKASNPFLRHREPAVIATLIQADKLAPNATALAAFTALREWKNHF